MARKPKPAGSEDSVRTVVSLVFSQLDLKLLHHVRRFIAGFMRAHPVKPSPDTLSRVMVAAHELLENSTKYGQDGDARLEVRMDMFARNKLTLRTTNRCTPADAKVVKTLLGRIDRSTPSKVYQELLRETVQRTDGGCGLGLARIAAECDMQVSMTFSNGELAIEAATIDPLPPAKGLAT